MSNPELTKLEYVSTQIAARMAQRLWYKLDTKYVVKMAHEILAECERLEGSTVKAEGDSHDTTGG